MSVPGNVISQRLHHVSVHAYLMSISYLWSSISSVVVTTAQVVLSISKMLTYSLYLHLICHGHVVLCCIFMEASRYLNHSPIILSIGHPHLHPFAQWVNPFCVSYGGFPFAQGKPYHRWEPIQMPWRVMQQVLHPGIVMGWLNQLNWLKFIGKTNRFNKNAYFYYFGQFRVFL